MVVADAAIAYAYYTLRETPVVNDSFNGKQLLVAFVRSTESAGVFDRRLDGRTLTFVEIDGKGETIEDNETGSQWNKLTGRGGKWTVGRQSAEKSTVYHSLLVRMERPLPWHAAPRPRGTD